MRDLNVRVELPGHGTFWWLTDEEKLEGALAPLDHCNKDGHIADAYTALFEDSYAHVFSDGRILRYSRQIAKREDLVELVGQ